MEDFLLERSGFNCALAIGYDQFDELLSGANEMDVHFRKEKFDQNIPVILALLSIWYNNFFDSETEAIIRLYSVPP